MLQNTFVINCPYSYKFCLYYHNGMSRVDFAFVLYTVYFVQNIINQDLKHKQISNTTVSLFLVQVTTLMLQFCNSSYSHWYFFCIFNVWHRYGYTYITENVTSSNSGNTIPKMYNSLEGNTPSVLVTWSLNFGCPFTSQ
jgi:hypothetical protein